MLHRVHLLCTYLLACSLHAHHVECHDELDDDDDAHDELEDAGDDEQHAGL